MGRTKVKVLFVCLGNICRSPLAEAVFRAKVIERGLASVFTIDSCGTANYHIGKQPDERTLQNARQNGVDLNHQARQFSVNDFYDFDYIIPMDDSNAQNIARLAPKNSHAEVYLMRGFDDTALNADVPDPYYGGEEGFQNVFEIINRSTEGLLNFILDKQQTPIE
ncbi:low molecular weight protein-tyrosine-phosphatase [Roseivirga echinicomitans]